MMMKWIDKIVLILVHECVCVTRMFFYGKAYVNKRTIPSLKNSKWNSFFYLEVSSTIIDDLPSSKIRYKRLRTSAISTFKAQEEEQPKYRMQYARIYLYNWNFPSEIAETRKRWAERNPYAIRETKENLKIGCWRRQHHSRDSYKK